MRPSMRAFGSTQWQTIASHHGTNWSRAAMANFAARYPGYLFRIGR